MLRRCSTSNGVMIFVICSKSAEITGEVVDYPYLPFLFHVLCRVFKSFGRKTTVCGPCVVRRTIKRIFLVGFTTRSARSFATGCIVLEGGRNND